VIAACVGLADKSDATSKAKQTDGEKRKRERTGDITHLVNDAALI